EMLRLERILEPNAAKKFRREIGNAGDADGIAFAERVSDAQRAVIGNAEDVAGPRLLSEVPLARQEEHRILDAHEPGAARMPQLHATAEAAGAKAQEGDAVAMLRIDIGLHLEDEGRDLLVLGHDRPRQRRLRPRRRGEIADPLNELAHAEIVERAAEEDRRQMASTVRRE